VDESFATLLSVHSRASECESNRSAEAGEVFARGGRTKKRSDHRHQYDYEVEFDIDEEEGEEAADSTYARAQQWYEGAQRRALFARPHTVPYCSTDGAADSRCHPSIVKSMRWPARVHAR
jgi:hypothetical protein